MENASKALIMAGTMLIAVLLLSLFAYLFTQGSAFNKEYNETMSNRELQAFNTKFEKYLDKNMTGDDVVSLLKLAIDNNKKVEYSSNDVIKVKVTFNSNTYETGTKTKDDTTEQNINGFLRDYAINAINITTQPDGTKKTEKIIFVCKKDATKYNKTTGKIQYIELKQESIEE